MVDTAVVSTGVSVVEVVVLSTGVSVVDVVALSMVDWPYAYKYISVRNVCPGDVCLPV